MSERARVRDPVDEGRYQDRLDRAGEIVEATDEVRAAQLEPDLFEGLALGGGPRARVGCVDAPARECDVARPAIVLGVGTLDHQHAQVVRDWTEHHRDRGPDLGVELEESRRPRVEARRDAFAGDRHRTRS